MNDAAATKCYWCTRELSVGRRVVAIPLGEEQLIFCSRSCLDSFGATGALDKFTPPGTTRRGRDGMVEGPLSYVDTPNAKEALGYRRTWYVEV